MYESGVVNDYAAEIWGFTIFVQNRAMCYYLGVHKFTPIVGMQGDFDGCRVNIRTPTKFPH